MIMIIMKMRATMTMFNPAASARRIAKGACAIHAFTLIELMTVMAVAGILVLLSVPTVVSTLRSSCLNISWLNLKKENMGKGSNFTIYEGSQLRQVLQKEHGGHEAGYIMALGWVISGRAGIGRVRG
ncbi:MAG: prepilin-type N-terminal cleavage/methylation domain-containing protein [Candidatus Methylacidiphilales bacterium]